MFDKNGDGTITPEELRTLMQSMNKSCTDTEIKKMIGKMDRDGERTDTSMVFNFQ